LKNGKICKSPINGVGAVTRNKDDRNAPACQLVGQIINQFAPEIDIKDGSLKVLGVSSAERLPEAPEIPPIVDAVPGFDVSNWSIILAPAGTPREIVNKLHAELKTVMAAPDVQDQLAKIGMIPIVSPTPEELESFVSSEVTRWGRIVQQAGIAGAH